MTATLTDLRNNLHAARATYGRGSSEGLAAFTALNRAASEAGKPLDGLRQHTANEVERFFAYTIPGVDGHVYWDGKPRFYRNDGRYRRPIRWWWAHRYGSCDPDLDLVNQCGEPNCINPEHHILARTRGSQIRWSDQKIIGALQVLAMRIGHSPTCTEYRDSRMNPTETIIRKRFGGWTEAIRAAGLPPVNVAGSSASRTSVLQGLRLARRVLQRWPSQRDYFDCHDQLAAAHLPTSLGPAKKFYGSWVQALEAAGAPRNDASTGAGHPGASAG